ncbi:MAG TPA: hypothetical protein VFZ16_05900 [Hyphomicrobiaceae bacterium]|nr:hypothetical protein [Hyphomicrobiaceae bacterium]
MTAPGTGVAAGAEGAAAGIAAAEGSAVAVAAAGAAAAAGEDGGAGVGAATAGAGEVDGGGSTAGAVWPAGVAVTPGVGVCASADAAIVIAMTARHVSQGSSGAQRLQLRRGCLVGISITGTALHSGLLPQHEACCGTHTGSKRLEATLLCDISKETKGLLIADLHVGQMADETLGGLGFRQHSIRLL